MSALNEQIAALRKRKNQGFDGEAHLTCEELDALLDVVEAAQASSWRKPGLQALLSRLEEVLK